MGLAITHSSNGYIGGAIIFGGAIRAAPRDLKNRGMSRGPPVPDLNAHRLAVLRNSIANRVNVSRIRIAARSVPRAVPDTFDWPPRRSR